MTLVKFANGKKDNVLNPLFNDVFESLFNDSFSDRMVSRVPAVNIAETDTNYQIELAVPGLKKSDFKISLNKQILTVRSDREAKNADEEKKYNKREYSFTSFVRSFTLPDTADHFKVDAKYVDGILRIEVGKKEEAKFQTREISVK